MLVLSIATPVLVTLLVALPRVEPAAGEAIARIFDMSDAARPNSDTEVALAGLTLAAVFPLAARFLGSGRRWAHVTAIFALFYGGLGAAAAGLKAAEILSAGDFLQGFVLATAVFGLAYAAIALVTGCLLLGPTNRTYIASAFRTRVSKRSS